MSSTFLGVLLLVVGGLAVWLGITGRPPVQTIGALLTGRPLPETP